MARFPSNDIEDYRSTEIWENAEARKSLGKPDMWIEPTIDPYILLLILTGFGEGENCHIAIGITHKSHEGTWNETIKRLKSGKKMKDDVKRMTTRPFQKAVEVFRNEVLKNNT
jgi:hypothetical protein